MNFEFNKRYTQIAIYIGAVAMLIIALVFACLNLDYFSGLFSKLISIASPLVYGFVFAYLLNPLMKFIEGHVYKRVGRKKPRPRAKRALSLVTTIVIVVIVLVVMVWMIIPQIGLSYKSLESQMNGYVASAQKWVEGLVEGDGFLATQLNKLVQYVNIDQILNSISDVIGEVYSFLISVVPYLMNLMTGIVNELKNALFGAVLSVYFLANKEKLCAQLKKSCCAFIKTDKVIKITDFINFTDQTFGGFISGKIVDSIIVAIIFIIVFAIVRMPYAPLLATILGVTNIIPFFGPFIGAIPCVLFVFISSPPKALLLIIIIFVVQQLDGNVIGPKVVGNKTGLSSFWIMVSITVMGDLLGLLGMFIGVPLFAVIYTTVKKITENRLRKRGLPEKTAEYIRKDDDGSEV